MYRKDGFSVHPNVSTITFCNEQSETSNATPGFATSLLVPLVRKQEKLVREIRGI